MKSLIKKLLVEYVETNDVIESDDFKRWFNGSKIVDDGGKPLVVYHGTEAKFNNFDPDKRQTRFGSKTGRGYYFTESKKYAEGIGPIIKKAYLSVKNPLFFTKYSEFYELMDKTKNNQNLSGEEKINIQYKEPHEILQHLGYDGAIYMFNGLMMEIMVLSEKQILVLE